MGWCLIEKQGGGRLENGEGPSFEYMWVNIYIYIYIYIYMSEKLT